MASQDSNIKSKKSDSRNIKEQDNSPTKLPNRNPKKLEPLNIQHNELSNGGIKGHRGSVAENIFIFGHKEGGIKEPNNTETIGVNQKKTIMSILKKPKIVHPNENERQYREDSHGIPIVKGSKKHKIVFKEKIHEVKLVENWKKYNSESYNPNSCHCQIFQRINTKNTPEYIS